MQNRIVITGMGAVTPLGIGVEAFWSNLIAGACGIGSIQQFDPAGIPIKLAAEVKDFHPEDLLPKSLIRETVPFMQFGFAAAEEAIRQSGLDLTDAPDRIGITLGTAMAGITHISDTQREADEAGKLRISPRFVPKVLGNIAAAQVAIYHGLHGPCFTLQTACSSGGDAINLACMLLQTGEADAMIAMGAESSICAVNMAGLASARALSRSEDPNTASRPFDLHRDGFVMGEGGGILVLEELEHAKARGAHIYAELAGYGASADAYHITSPRPGGETCAKALTRAIQDAGIAPTDIQYYNAHGTSTHLNDSTETAMLKIALGEHAYKIKVSSTKSMTGHCVGAAGAIEAIISTLAITNSYFPATINLDNPDEDCDLDYVPNVGVSGNIDCAASASLGFGGHNGIVILKKFRD